MNTPRAAALCQLLMIGFDRVRWTSSCERFLRRCRPGGVLLSVRSPQATAELLRKIAVAVGSPLFLALEEEGGTVDPLRAFFPPLPSQRAAGQRGPSAVARLGRLSGAALKLLGFNTHFAPVLDLGTSSSEHSDGRTFSTKPEEVARCGEAFVRGLGQHNVFACGKHFPGLSGANVECDSALPVVGKSMADLWREDLVPYRRLLPLLPMVLISHAAYKAHDFDLPCSAALSASVVEGLLRVRLGYRRLAIGEKLECEAVRGPLDLGEAAVKSVNVGCDLLVVRGEKNVEGVLASLKNGLDSGKLASARIEQALERIRVAKKGMALPSRRSPNSVFHQLAREIEDFREEFQPEEWKIA